jgi:C1A family cysteine protease
MSRYGWRRQNPDLRDYTVRHPLVAAMLRRTRVGEPLPSSVDLREGCAPIQDQGHLGSCTAFAAAGVLTFMEYRATGKYVDPSTLAIYKWTRDAMGLIGDSGADIRTTIQTIVNPGAPPESLWPYDIARFDEEPPDDVKLAAHNYRALTYVSIDPPDVPAVLALGNVKRLLASGIPVMYGFTVYKNAIDAAERSGQIPFPSKNDSVEGGHGNSWVGYDDDLVIAGDQGALLSRNQWGTGWGEDGYGWLPYRYLLDGLASDLWAVLSESWVETGRFS